MKRDIEIPAPAMKKILSNMAIENLYLFHSRVLCIDTATPSFERHVVTGLTHAVSNMFSEANQYAMASLCSDLETYSYALIVHVQQLVRHRATVGGMPDVGSFSPQYSSLFDVAYCLVVRVSRIQDHDRVL